MPEMEVNCTFFSKTHSTDLLIWAFHLQVSNFLSYQEALQRRKPQRTSSTLRSRSWSQVAASYSTIQCLVHGWSALRALGIEDEFIVPCPVFQTSWISFFWLSPRASKLQRPTSSCLAASRVSMIMISDSWPLKFGSFWFLRVKFDILGRVRTHRACPVPRHDAGCSANLFRSIRPLFFFF